jgi:hypothetical protein
MIYYILRTKNKYNMIIIKSIKRHERNIVDISTVNSFSLWLLKLFLLDVVRFIAKLTANWLGFVSQ